ncbi:MAG TPA: hypothetical protein VHU82_09975 [Vicinamibacterales bacterium]|jgi:hypothetical protein|nr:hypothetical protein [Vicinamibacterales bacterium]
MNMLPEPVLHRIRCEYLEMPGMRLTIRQAARLWNLDETTCAAVMARLVDAAFLKQTPAGAFALAASS